jgi:peptidoglycan/xylan/chitin deacetylase (PgdA/CDA1 family)
MPYLTLMYHDVVLIGAEESSGFQIPGAASYKLSREHFEKHLDAVEEAVGKAHVGLVGAGQTGSDWVVLLTFDDGGISASTTIGPLLARRGWRGHFFVTTDRIGTTGFVSADDVRELSRQGHIIGSHSRTHPRVMSDLPPADLASEWAESRKRLSEIIGVEVRVASVPGGHYSKRVAAAAAASGLKVLFTSEPTLRVADVEGCRVLGRYTIRRSTPARVVRALAGGRAPARWRQGLARNMKEAARRTCGPVYAPLRQWILGPR